MLILIRLGGEISLKSSRVSRRFIRILVENIRDALRSEGHEAADVTYTWNRVSVSVAAKEAPGCLARIPGIQSYAVVEAECVADLQTIVAEGLALHKDSIQGKSFAVRCIRSGTQNFRSIDVNQALGAALKATAGATVNLTNPEYFVNVEVRDEVAYFFKAPVRGLGGLPLRSSGRALCLMSGGFDSPVAAWLLQKRGVAVDYLFCNLAGAAYERSVLLLAKLLADKWSYGSSPRFYAVDFEALVKDMKEKTTPSYQQVLLKRQFYAMGARFLAADEHLEALITGEAVGQVSSQTLQNLTAISQVNGALILRPLLAFNKDDIVALAEQIGSSEASSQIKEFCQLTKHKPVTAGRVKIALREESKLDATLAEIAFETKKSFELRKVKLSELLLPYVLVETIPQGAEVIDCRSSEEYQKWHYPGSRQMDYYSVLENLKLFSKDQTYVFYCDVGLQSSVIAEKLQSRGYQAYSLKDGLSSLRP